MFMVLPFTPFSSPAYMGHRDRLSWLLASGWVWPIGSLGKWSTVCEWGRGIYFQSFLHGRLHWAVFIPLTITTALFKTSLPSESLPFYITAPSPVLWMLINLGDRAIFCGSPQLANIFMKSHFVIKVSLNYLECSICFLLGTSLKHYLCIILLSIILSECQQIT